MIQAGSCVLNFDLSFLGSGNKTNLQSRYKNTDNYTKISESIFTKEI